PCRARSYVPGAHRALLSFPTRRSSDLHLVPLAPRVVELLGELRRLTGHGALLFPHRVRPREPMGDSTLLAAMARVGFGDFTPHRSEEHTSELQSRENLVCRLLLEKKKR